MPDSTPGAADPQAGDVVQPQAGTDPTPQAGGAQTAQAASATAQGGTGSDLALLQREVEELRKSEAKYRTENKRLSESQKAIEDAKLSEAEKLQARLVDLERRNTELLQQQQEQRFRDAAYAVASRLGFRSPELAPRLIERSSVEYADDGRPRNLERLLSEILKQEPYLARSAPDFGGGDRGPAPQGTDMNDWIRKAARQS